MQTCDDCNIYLYGTIDLFIVYVIFLFNSPTTGTHTHTRTHDQLNAIFIAPAHLHTHSKATRSNWLHYESHYGHKI